MEIQYLGHSSFKIRGKKTTLITDPFNPNIGLKFPKVSADLVTISHQHEDHNYLEGVVGSSNEKEPFIIAGPGEYEVGEVSVFGIASFHDSQKGTKRGRNTIYTINLDNHRLVHLGDLGEELNEEQLEEINGAEVLFVPVGGTFTLNAKEAANVVSQIEPKIIIPMHYQLPGLIYQLLPLEEFLKEMEVSGIEPLDKLVVSKEKLPEEREVVILNARS